MTCCARCGGTGEEPGASPAEMVEHLRATCRERSLWVSPDGMVRETEAADLIGWQTKTLRNRRYADAPIPFTMRAGRPLYALSDLAAWLAQG